jgi:hypothetical protein
MMDEWIDGWLHEGINKKYLESLSQGENTAWGCFRSSDFEFED